MLTKIVGNEDPIATLCRMAIETGYEDIPAPVIDFAKKHILDTVGITIGGSGWEGVPQVVEYVKAQGGKKESLIPFYGPDRVPAAMAAFAIGPMTRALDMGDCHEDAMHSAEYTLPSMLAALGLRKKVSGKDFITAFVVGQEILIRIGAAYKAVTSNAVAAGHQSGHYVFGPVASVGKLLGLDQDTLENAEGIISCMTQPHSLAMYHPPSLMARVHHSFIGRDAIDACLLAQKGITGPREEVLIGPRGFLTLFAKWKTDPSLLTRGLGEEWMMTTTEMKGYLSCRCTHTAVDGILAQMKEHKFKFSDIDKIHVDECTHNWNCVCDPVEMRWKPGTVPECQWSLPYAVATAVIEGNIFINSYTPEARARKEVRDLMARITAKEDPNLPPWAARVATTLKNGTVYRAEYPYAKGHRMNPFTESDYLNKFRACAGFAVRKLNNKVIDSLIDNILNLEKVNDVAAALVQPLI